MSLSQDIAAIVEFALPDKAVWRHYFKKAKKDMRFNRNGGGTGKWSGYGDWDVGRGGKSKAPVLLRGTDNSELSKLVGTGKFASSWSLGTSSTDGTPANWTSASHRIASLYAASNGDSGRLLGLRKTLATSDNLHKAAVGTMGGSTTNFPLNKPIKDSDLRLVLKRTKGPAWSGSGPSVYEAARWRRPMAVGEIYPGMTHGPRPRLAKG